MRPTIPLAHLWRSVALLLALLVLLVYAPRRWQTQATGNGLAVAASSASASAQASVDFSPSFSCTRWHDLGEPKMNFRANLKASAPWLVLANAEDEPCESIEPTGQQKDQCPAHCEFFFNGTTSVCRSKGGPQNCAFDVSPEEMEFEAEGGVKQGVVNTIPPTGLCIWGTKSDEPWVIVTPSGAPRGGPFFVQTLPNDGPARQTLITVAGKPVVVKQKAKCLYTVAPLTIHFDAAGGIKTVSVITDASCFWTAFSNDSSWLSVAPNGGEGTGNLIVIAAPNNGPARQTTIDVALQVVNVIQDGLSIACQPIGNTTLTDPAGCPGPDGKVGVTAEVFNDSAAPVTVQFTAALPPEMLGLPGTCATPFGACQVTQTAVTWSGTLAPNQIVSIEYQAQIAPGISNGTSLTINNSAIIGGSRTEELPYTFKLDCPNPPTPPATESCGASSLRVPLFTHGFQKTPELPNGDLFLLPPPLTLTLVTSDPGTTIFPVNAGTFGVTTFDPLTGFLNAPTEGVSLSTPNMIARAVSCQDSFREISFEIASTATPGDKVRLFRQRPNGFIEQTLALFTVETGGMRVTELHPNARLYLNHRLATGPGNLAVNDLVPLNLFAGDKGLHTGLLTLVLDDTLSECLQLGLDLQRAGATGRISLVLTEAVVNRTQQPGDDRRAMGHLRGLLDGYPTGVPCGVVCPICPFTAQPDPRSETSLAVTSSLNPALPGKSVNLTATLTPNQPRDTAPTGEIVFTSGQTVLGSAPLIATNNGLTASLTVVPPLGMSVITATYAGDNNYHSSMGHLMQTVLAAPPLTLNSLLPNSVSPGQLIFISVLGSGFNPGAKVEISGAGVSAEPASLVSITMLRVPVRVSAFAIRSFRGVTITNPDGSAMTKEMAFRIQ